MVEVTEKNVMAVRNILLSKGLCVDSIEAATEAVEYLAAQSQKAVDEATRPLVEALEWYAEPTLPYAITQASEPRSAVHADGGKRAREALAQHTGAQ